uniref:Msx2-interacting protein n=1 Tax=Schistocephalus solidus TaxID=70667 RepID=A0A0X3P7Y2_SCHSO
MRITRYLWISNLPASATEEDIRNALNSHGKIQNVRIHDAGQTHGAVVAFLDTKSATKAIESSVKINKTVLRLQYCESSGIPCCSSNTAKAANLQKPAQRPRSSSLSDSKSIAGEDIDTESSSSSPYSSRSSSPQCGYSKKNQSYSPAKRDHRKTSMDSKRHTRRESRASRSSNLRGLRITQLPLRSSDTNLREGLFHEYKKHGKITSIVVKGSGPSRSAHITFKLAEDAEKAYEHSKGKVFFGVAVRSELMDGLDLEDPDLCPPEHAMDEYHPKATKTLFVGNLCSASITQEDLRRVFQIYGDIIEIDIKTQTNQPGTSYAFVQYCDIKSVVRALCDQENVRISGKQVKLGFGKSQPSNVVWLDNLSVSMTEAFLVRQFGRYGRLNHVVLDRKLLRALLYFDTIEAAQRALNETRNRTFIGKKVQIDYATYECQVAFMRKMAKGGGLSSFYGNYREKIQEILAACWPSYGNVFQIMDDSRSCTGGNTRRMKESISSVNISDGSLLTSSRSRFSNSRSRHSNSRSGSTGKGSICSSRNSPSRDVANCFSSSGRGHLLPNPGSSTSVHYKQSVPSLPSTEPLGFDRRQASRISSSSRFDEYHRSNRKTRMSQGRKSNTSYPNGYSRMNGSYQHPTLTDYVCVDSSPTGPYPSRSRSRRKYYATSSCSESSPERTNQLETWSSSKRRSSPHLGDSDGTHTTVKRNDETQCKEAASQRSQRSLARHEKSRRANNSGSRTPNPPEQPSSGAGNSKGNPALPDTPQHQSNTGPPPQLAVDVAATPEGSSSAVGNASRPLDPSMESKQFVAKVPLLEEPPLPTERKPFTEMETPALLSRTNQSSFKTAPSCLANFEALTELERERAELLRQLSLLKTASVGSQPSDSVSQTFSNSEMSSNSTERPNDQYSGPTSTYSVTTVAYSQPCAAGSIDAKDSIQVDRLSKRDFSVLYSAASGSAGHSSSSDPGDVLFSPMGQSSEMLSPLPPLPPPPISAPRDHTHLNYSHNGKLFNTGSSPAIQAFAPTPASPPYGSIASPPQWEHGTASTIESDLPMYSRARLSSFDSALFKSNRDPRLSTTVQQPQSASCTYRPLWIEISGRDGLQQTEQTEKPLQSPQKPRCSVSETENLSLSDSEQDPFLHTDATDSSLDERIRLLDAKLKHSEKLRPAVDYSKFRLRRKSGAFASHGATVDSDKPTPSPLLSPPSPFHKISSSIPPFVQSTSPTSTSGSLFNRLADTSEFVKSMLSSKPPVSTSNSDFSVPPSNSFQLNSGELPVVSTRSIETEKPTFAVSTTVSQDPVLSLSTTQPLVSTASPLPPRFSDSSHIPPLTKTCVTTPAPSVSSAPTTASETPSSAHTQLRAVPRPATGNFMAKGKPTPKKDVPTVVPKVQSNSRETVGLHFKDFFTPQATQIIQTNKKTDKKLCSSQLSAEAKPKERGPITPQVVSRDVSSLFMELGSKRKLPTTTVPYPPKSPKLTYVKPKPKELGDKVCGANVSEKKAIISPSESRPVAPSLKQKVKETHALSKIVKKSSQMTPDTLNDVGEPTRKLSEKDNPPGRRDSSFMSPLSAAKSKHSEQQANVHTLGAQTHLKGDSAKRRRLKKKKDSDEEDWKPVNSSTSNKDSSTFYFEEFGADSQYESMYDKIKRRANKDAVDGNSGTQSKPEALKSFLKSRKKAARSKEQFDFGSGRDSDTDECLSEDVESPVSHDSAVQVQPCSSESVTKKRKKTSFITKAREHDPQQVTVESSSVKPTKVSGKKSRLKRPLSPETGSAKRTSDMETSMETPKLGNKLRKLRRSTNSQKATKESRVSELILKKATPTRDRKPTGISGSKKAKNAPSVKRHLCQVFTSSDSDSSSSQSKPSGGFKRTHTKKFSVSTTPSSSPHIIRSCSPSEVFFTPPSGGNLLSKGPQTPTASKELEEELPASNLTPESFTAKNVSSEASHVQMTDANDEIPQLEKQVEDDLEPVRGSTLPPEDIDQCQSSELIADPTPTEPKLGLVSEQISPSNSSEDRPGTADVVLENVVDSLHDHPASLHDQVDSLLPTASHLSVSNTEISDATSPPEEPPALFSAAETGADLGEEVSGLDILSNAATQSLLSERIFPPKQDQAVPASSEPLTPRSLQFLTPVGQAVSVVAATAAAVPSGAPLVQAHPVLAPGQSPGGHVQQHIALLLNPNSQTFSPLNASKFNPACDSSTTALNKPTFVLAAAPLSSRDVTLAPATMTATLSFVGPVGICQGVDKLIAGRPISDFPTISNRGSDTIPSSAQCISPLCQPVTVTSVASSIEPVSVCQVTENPDRSSYTSYVQRVIERVKQEKDEESMHSREKVKRTKKSVQKVSTLICSGVSTGILSPNSSVINSASHLNGAETLPSPTLSTVNCASPLQYSQIPPSTAKDVNCSSGLEHSYVRRTRRLSQASSVSSETRELVKTDPYEPNFDEDFCQPTNQNPTGSNLGSRSFASDTHPPSPSDPQPVCSTRDSVDEVIDSVVQGEFSHEEYVQKVISGTLTASVTASAADGRSQPRTKASTSSKASSVGTSRKLSVRACSFQPSSLVDDRQHQQQQQSLSPMPSPNAVEGTRPPSVPTTGQASAAAGLLSPLRVLTLVANTPAAAATVNIAPKKEQYLQPSQVSPRVVTPVATVTAEQKPPTAAAAAAATLLLNPALSSGQLAAAASMEPASYASSFAAQLANSYLSLLNQQQQQQHRQQAALSSLHRRGDAGSSGDLTGGVAKGLAAAAAAAASLPAGDVLDRSPHEAAEYFAAAATMAAMAVMQPGLGRVCASEAASSPLSEGTMRHVIPSPTTNFATVSQVISSTPPPPSTFLPDNSRLRWPTSQLPEDKFPLQWSGFMALKNDKVYVQMHYLSGNRDLIRTCMNVIADRLPSVEDSLHPDGIHSIHPILRITQRMRLENPQLEAVQAKLREPNSFCMCLALAGAPVGGSEFMTEELTRNNVILQENFIMYMQEKVAAGIISCPPSQENPFVMHIFPPCDFSRTQLQQVAPELLRLLTQSAIPHMLIVVV